MKKCLPKESPNLKCLLASPFLIVRAVRLNSPSQIISDRISSRRACTVKQAHRCNNQEPDSETQSASHFLTSKNQCLRSTYNLLTDTLISETKNEGVYKYIVFQKYVFTENR
uniref:Uncharacterized protein n=1 Tax=Salix viminalis TaxID=40686 RepID=A0A6N2N0M5_SALVM